MSDTIKKIDNYLQVGGLFNPELMEHHKVSDLLFQCRKEIERLRTSLGTEQDCGEYYRGEIGKLRAENVKLKVALEEIAYVPGSTLAECINIARATLEDRT